MLQHSSLREPTSLDAVGPLSLDHDQRMFVYGLAAWLARADGNLLGTERDALLRLGNALGLTHEERLRAAVASHAIRDVLDDDPGDHDVLALARVLSHKGARPHG